MDEDQCDHAEAWDLAHYKRAVSNSARCYIDLRVTVELSLRGNKHATEKLRQIVATADDDAKAHA